MFPEYQKLFRGFADTPMDQLPENRRFKAHAFTVVSAINGLIDNLDDPEMLCELLVKTGQNHAKRSIKIGDFKVTHPLTICTIHLSLHKCIHSSSHKHMYIHIQLFWSDICLRDSIYPSFLGGQSSRNVVRNSVYAIYIFHLCRVMIEIH